MTDTPPISRLLDIMAKLRDPDGGCPWDVKQNFATIAPYTIEEAYEVADAIERGDMGDLRDELGDLLLQVVFHARMAQEDGAFEFNDVVASISDKMIRRHPHVFGAVDIKTAAAQTVAWEEQKAAERQEKAGADDHSALDGLTVALPSLTRAEKLQKRAARVGFDWDQAADVLHKIREETDELAVEMDRQAEDFRLEEEMGDLLFSCVNLARKLAIDPEKALRHANGKFERRFRHVERSLRSRGRELEQATLEEMEAAWTVAKTAPFNYLIEIHRCSGPSVILPGVMPGRRTD